MSLLRQIPVSTWCFIVGGLLSFIFVALGTVLKFTEESRAKLESSERVLALQRDLADARKDNIRLQNAVTGGDSFCSLQVDATAQDATLFVVHQGDFPLYDASLRIIDVDEFSAKAKDGAITRDYLFNGDNTHTVGNLAPSSARTIGSFKVGDRRSIALNVFFSARNGFLTETLRMIKVDGAWEQAIRVTNMPTKGDVKTLYEKIDDGFPRDPSGQVHWD